VYSTNPWFHRGANIGDGVIAGVFAFHNNTASHGGISFRVGYITILK